MITQQEVEDRLAAVGLKNKFWGKAEMRELQKIIVPEEEIIAAVSGRYMSGFALLAATNLRLLLIAKKLVTMSLEDIRYEMIAEVGYSAGVLESMIKITTLNKTMSFSSIRQSRLRQLTSYVQGHVMELRQGMAIENQTTPLQQAYVSLPLTHDQHKGYVVPNSAARNSHPAIHSFRRPAGTNANPYPSTSLTTRRRVSRFYPSQQT